MENIKDIAKKIEKAGGKLYLVGGAVRDKILNTKTHDEDYCIVGLSIEEFMNLFPNAHIRGKSFFVFVIDNKEFAMARTEKKIGKGHKEFEIQTNKDISIEEDLSRRDITINAMAQDVLTKEIIDPYGGKKDLENSIIRATTNHFAEDPLRVYRVARFAAKLNFTVESKTIKMMKELKSELSTLPKERVFAEFRKALESDVPSMFFESIKKAEVLDIHFKEIQRLIGALQPIKYHPEGDAYNHTMKVLDMSAELTKNFEENRKLQIRFAALVHDLGKGLTRKEEYPHHYGHEIRGVEAVSRFCKNINAPKTWIECGKTAAREHMRARNI